MLQAVLVLLSFIFFYPESAGLEPIPESQLNPLMKSPFSKSPDFSKNINYIEAKAGENKTLSCSRNSKWKFPNDSNADLAGYDFDDFGQRHGIVETNESSLLDIWDLRQTDTGLYQFTNMKLIVNGEEWTGFCFDISDNSTQKIRIINQKDFNYVGNPNCTQIFKYYDPRVGFDFGPIADQLPWKQSGFDRGILLGDPSPNGCVYQNEEIIIELKVLMAIPFKSGTPQMLIGGTLVNCSISHTFYAEEDRLLFYCKNCSSQDPDFIDQLLKRLKNNRTLEDIDAFHKSQSKNGSSVFCDCNNSILPGTEVEMTSLKSNEEVFEVRRSFIGYGAYGQVFLLDGYDEPAVEKCLMSKNLQHLTRFKQEFEDFAKELLERNRPSRLLCQDLCEEGDFVRSK
ncbi:unnamed protein product, partial [Mesorhabditis belari]|uniref:Protein kinase domain-containing protein n=1 Tax=Mesorhabditis belari TaxID=2138241 RepID=A0AAF3EKE8_9BILA